ncbi:MAG: 16S rRNA (guanine(527)-N(7))-methyltransferase RsmG [Bacteroidales bacterium]|nr:16S rRNA (guanine(527)-N(7))-methyltransferase RsmG [Bacteroidales bacterium]
MEFKEFIDIARESFPFITEDQEKKFAQLEALYRDWNAKINVISRKDIDELYRHHVLHSLAIAAYLKGTGVELAPEGVPAKILDLGTGGGFPGIPLAILFPEHEFTLCDSIGKKITVAGGVAQALGLGNVKTVNARAESLPETFDWVVSRAVTSLDNFMPWVKGKYTKGILYLKGGDIAEEIAVAMAKCKLPKGSVRTWPVNSWLRDEYFDQKFVIHIEKRG